MPPRVRLLLPPLLLLALLAVPAPALAQAPTAPVAPPPPLGDEAGPAEHSALARDGSPMAGWHNGLFYLRDYNDNFRLYVQGRGQIDAYGWAGPGVPDVAALKPTMLLRRIRPEITGEIVREWSFMLAGELGGTAIDNPSGAATETRAAAPGADPSASSASYASAQTPRITASAADVFINYRPTSLFNLQFGQFDAPFTMEGRTSDKYFPFAERSIIRNVSIATKELGVMAWGETDDRLWYYSIGVFNGDGPNRLNTDSRVDGMLRTFMHPAIGASDPVIRNLQIGGSLRYGSRDSRWTNYDYSPMITQTGYAFWKPTYSSAKGTVHILPAGDQVGAAGELRIPFSIFDLTSEFVVLKNGTREAVEGYQTTNTERFGDMRGYSYYVQLGVWPFGDRDITGLPGYENIPHVDFKKADPVLPHYALQLLAKWEQVALTYAGASRNGANDPQGLDGDIRVNTFSLGANYWATRHIRLTANYVMDMFPDSGPSTPSVAGGPAQTSSNRAMAPGNTLGKGVNDAARDNAHVMHEVVLRVGVAL